MDDNNGSRYNREWDRWNSNASNSSYYNQPVHRPYGRGFSNASLILGALSIAFGGRGLALPLGSLGILFALLVYRKGSKLNSTAKSGLILSCIGTVIGIVLLIGALMALPEILKQLNEMRGASPYDTNPAAGYDIYTDFLNQYYDILRN